MRREMILNEEKGQLRAAIKEDGSLVELIMERSGERTMVGAIFRGVVRSVMPSMQAAFIDLGRGKNGFLHVADIVEDPEVYDRMFKLRGERIEDGAEMVEADDVVEENGDSDGDNAGEESKGLLGRFVNFALGRGKQKPEIKQEKPQRQRSRRRRREKLPVIQDLLKEGQNMTVQVAKEALGSKGPRLTSHIALPGKFLVLMPREDKMGVSQQIKSDAERKRLRDLARKVKPKGVGLIVRTAGEGQNEEDFRQEVDNLLAVWQDVNKKAGEGVGPKMLHQDDDMLLRLIRDQSGLPVDSVITNSRRLMDKLRNIFKKTDQRLLDKLRLYDKQEPIFKHYGVSEEIEKALREKVKLKSGGFIVINQTEALVAIDVNTGKFTSASGMRQAILTTNLDAAAEVARQLRLRDIGGIVVIDFIDMDHRRDQERVLNKLREACRADKSRTKIYPVSRLGLVEMTRKRVRRGLATALTETCQTCGGRGYIIK